MRNDLAGEIANELGGTRKYRHICEETLSRIARWALDRHDDRGKAVKAAKRKLHQVYGAFFEKIDFQGLGGLVRDLSESSTEAEIRAVCRKILQLHSSTAERISILEEVYLALLKEAGSPETVVDLGCGLNPFALPWMGLGAETTYWAHDIDARLISIVNDFLALLGRPTTAECRDLLVSHPTVKADLWWLPKERGPH